MCEGNGGDTVMHARAWVAYVREVCASALM